MIIDLPPDLLCRIYADLDVCSLASLARVCRSFRADCSKCAWKRHSEVRAECVTLIKRLSRATLARGDGDLRSVHRSFWQCFGVAGADDDWVPTAELGRFTMGSVVYRASTEVSRFTTSIDGHDTVIFFITPLPWAKAVNFSAKPFEYAWHSCRDWVAMSLQDAPENLAPPQRHLLRTMEYALTFW